MYVFGQSDLDVTAGSLAPGQLDVGTVQRLVRDLRQQVGGEGSRQNRSSVRVRPGMVESECVGSAQLAWSGRDWRILSCRTNTATN